MICSFNCEKEADNVGLRKLRRDTAEQYRASSGLNFREDFTSDLGSGRPRRTRAGLQRHPDL